MRFSDLLAVVSAGSVLVVAGAVLVGIGFGLGLNQAAPALPLWLCMMLFGAGFGLLGFVMVDRGGEKTAEKVEESLTLQSQIAQHPALATAVALLAGLVLYRLARARPPQHSPEPAAASNGKANAASTGLFSSLGGQLQSLGTLASGAAMTFGLRALGVPTVQQLFEELMGKLGDQQAPEREQPKAPESSRTARSVPRFEI